MRSIAAIKLDDDKAERVRRDHAEAIAELQNQPAMHLITVKNVTLVNATAKLVPHSLGRSPEWVATSSPRGAASAGYIVESRDGTFDRTQFVKLTANGYGATITVDVEVR